jgi:signal transduction histidine kinase
LGFNLKKESSVDKKSIAYNIKRKIIFSNLLIFATLFAIISFVVYFAINNLVENFLEISTVQSKEGQSEYLRSSNFTQRRIQKLLTSSLRKKTDQMIEKDGPVMRTLFLENSFLSVREFLQKNFINDEEVVLASFFVKEGREVKAWHYIDREHPEGLALKVIYNKKKLGWEYQSKKGEDLFLSDPMVLTYLKQVKKEIRLTSFNTANVFEGIIPVFDPENGSLKEQLQKGDAVGFLRYIVSLNKVEALIEREKKEVLDLLEKQKMNGLKSIQQTRLVGNKRLYKTLSILTIFGLIIMLLSYWPINFFTSIMTDKLIRFNRVLKIAKDKARKAHIQMAELQSELLRSAHSAGMAEIAIGVLHDMGNILNSVNVSHQIVINKVKQSKVSWLVKAAKMMDENKENLGDYLTHDKKGKELPAIISKLSSQSENDLAIIRDEMESIKTGLGVMKQFILTQQDYANPVEYKEKISLSEVIDDTLALEARTLQQGHIDLVKNISYVPFISAQKNKVINIVFNILKNACHSVRLSNKQNKTITISLSQEGETISLSILDNGIGIKNDSLKTIFNRGQSSKGKGHGYGLHSSANSIKEIGGEIIVKSEGLDKGAEFILNFPIPENEEETG